MSNPTWNGHIQEICGDEVYIFGESDRHGAWWIQIHISQVPEDLRELGVMCSVSDSDDNVDVDNIVWCREKWTAEEINDVKRKSNELFQNLFQEENKVILKVGTRVRVVDSPVRVDVGTTGTVEEILSESRVVVHLDHQHASWTKKYTVTQLEVIEDNDVDDRKRENVVLDDGETSSLDSGSESRSCSEFGGEEVHDFGGGDRLEKTQLSSRRDDSPFFDELKDIIDSMGCQINIEALSMCVECRDVAQRKLKDLLKLYRG